MIGGGGRPRGPEGTERPTGRGTADDPDVPQGRLRPRSEDPKAEIWEATPLTNEQLRNPVSVIRRPAAARRLLWQRQRPLVSRRSMRPSSAAPRLRAPGDGHVVLFSNNPFWRAETKGSYFLVFNAILNFDNLAAGRKLADK